MQDKYISIVSSLKPVSITSVCVCVVSCEHTRTGTHIGAASARTAMLMHAPGAYATLFVIPFPGGHLQSIMSRAKELNIFSYTTKLLVILFRFLAKYSLNRVRLFCLLDKGFPTSGYKERVSFHFHLLASPLFFLCIVFSGCMHNNLVLNASFADNPEKSQCTRAEQ